MKNKLIVFLLLSNLVLAQNFNLKVSPHLGLGYNINKITNKNI